MKKLVIIFGSESDLPQCKAGLEDLKASFNGEMKVYIRSCHRHKMQLYELLRTLSTEGTTGIIICVAGWAAALPGDVDAFLRYTLRDDRIKVIGVGAVCADDSPEKNLAARLSIQYVPKTQVAFAGMGSDGFLSAVKMAYANNLPELKLPDIPLPKDLTLDQAIKLASQN